MISVKSKTKYKMLPIKEDTYNYIISQTKGKESYDKTLKRVLKIKEAK